MNGLQKILDLIKKTGDRLVVLETESETAYVVMTLEDYEKLMRPKSHLEEMSEGELLEKINQDMATWRAHQAAEEDAWLPPEPPDFAQDDWWSARRNEDRLADFPEFDQEIAEEEKNPEDQYYFEPVEA